VSSRRIVSAYEIYLSERGIHCTKIPEALTKTPDYELVCDERRYLNELKSPSLNLDPITGMYRFSAHSGEFGQAFRSYRTPLGAVGGRGATDVCVSR
jgi:hypothetical protein